MVENISTQNLAEVVRLLLSCMVSSWPKTNGFKLTIKLSKISRGGFGMTTNQEVVLGLPLTISTRSSNAFCWSQKLYQDPWKVDSHVFYLIDGSGNF